jgi:hypothetical protein
VRARGARRLFAVMKILCVNHRQIICHPQAGKVGTLTRIRLYHGAQLEDYCLIEPGTFCFIPPGVPHIAFNLSDSEPATAISSRNDAAEQENVALVPELEGLRDKDIDEKKRR